MDQSSIVKDELEIFKRQYLQLVDVKHLRWPSDTTLRHSDSQSWLYHELFEQSTSKYLLPERYQLRVLKLLFERIEHSVQDPEEDVGAFLLFVINVYNILFLVNAKYNGIITHDASIIKHYFLFLFYHKLNLMKLFKDSLQDSTSGFVCLLFEFDLFCSLPLFSDIF
jgi:hypothetical protein